MFKKSKQPRPRKRLSKKKKIIIGVFLALLLIVGGSVGVYFLFLREKPVEEEPEVKEEVYVEPIYSKLTGLEIENEALNSSPTFCIQIPNGSNDGARPQAGLNDAAIVFEAIAEAGITRFAAVFQNATVSAIGPVRSLRPYYLDWDTPFDCTVVHAGGSAEAMVALYAGGQRELNESWEYMWREYGTPRNWNNLMTSPALLTAYNNAMGWTTSTPKVFARFKPKEVSELLEKRQECERPLEEGEERDEQLAEECGNYTKANSIAIEFSGNYSHNAVYNYDANSNKYLRSHQDGEPHLSYNCPPGLDTPDTMNGCGEPTQIAPSVVVAMEVYETFMSDGYHQNIRTIGAGDATIFQNGEVIKGTWAKNSQNEQIIFRDAAGNIINFTPGQVWISAVPQYGQISWQ